MKKTDLLKGLIASLRKGRAPLGRLTLAETLNLAERHEVAASDVAVAEAMHTQGLNDRQVVRGIMDAFRFNLLALEVGLSQGESFLLGRVGRELAEQMRKGNVLNKNRLIDRAIIYTLAAEVGNHTMGLQPCAGTGDSCVYTGLMKALLETKRSRDAIGRIAALMLKIGTLFKEGKQTTGCNMEGYGAGSAVTAAALTEFRGGGPRDVARALVLAMSPTIGVPCTPRVIVSGLCATHIGGAIVMGDLASSLALKTSLPVTVDADVMLAMAARVHSQAAPVITGVNLDYMRPYFKKNAEVDRYIAEETRIDEAQKAERVVEGARAEIRQFAATANPITRPFGEAVVGGSSIAVGSPTNMGRIAHELFRGEIKKITIELTTDLFARRVINVPGILMGGVFGASTNDIKMYNQVLKLVREKGIKIVISQVDEPEVQRIRIEATGRDGAVDALNRGGGRIRLVNAKPSLEDAVRAAEKLGIKLAQV
jgi:L-serine dehydratase